MARVRHHRDGLALALEGVDAAIADVTEKLGMAVAPETKTTNIPRRRA
jgi:hypothetical protein